MFNTLNSFVNYIGEDKFKHFLENTITGLTDPTKKHDGGGCNPERHPAFYGCFDWHSAVHSHWQLLRVINFYPDFSEKYSELYDQVISLLHSSFQKEKMEKEVDFLKETSDEVPYGIAWSLILASEVHLFAKRKMDDCSWINGIESLEEYCKKRIEKYLEDHDKPVKANAHYQTALAVTLALSYAKSVRDIDFEAYLKSKAHSYFSDPETVIVESDGFDFLSHELATADLMRKIESRDNFNDWFNNLTKFVDFEAKFRPNSMDVSGVGHTPGLNMSRAWMLAGIKNALNQASPYYEVISKLEQEHFETGWGVALDDDWMVSHWAPTFLVYYATGAGL